jgi:hypothetical protein
LHILARHRQFEGRLEIAGGHGRAARGDHGIQVERSQQLDGVLRCDATGLGQRKDVRHDRPEADEHGVAEQLVERREVRAFAEVVESPGHSGKLRLDAIEDRFRPADQHAALGISGRRGAHEDGAVQIADALGAKPRSTFRRELRLRGAVVDHHRIGGESRARGRNDLRHDSIVLEDQVDPLGAPYRVGGGGGSLDAERRQGQELVRRTVPCGDGVPAPGGGFRECAAEQPGTEKGDGGHGSYPQRVASRWHAKDRIILPATRGRFHAFDHAISATAPNRAIVLVHLFPLRRPETNCNEDSRERNPLQRRTPENGDISKATETDKPADPLNSQRRPAS